MSIIKVSNDYDDAEEESEAKIEKYYQEWRKCIELLRESMPYLKYVSLVSPYEKQILNVESLMERIQAKI